MTPRAPGFPALEALIPSTRDGPGSPVGAQSLCLEQCLQTVDAHEHVALIRVNGWAVTGSADGALTAQPCPEDRSFLVIRRLGAEVIRDSQLPTWLQPALHSAEVSEKRPSLPSLMVGGALEPRLCS